MQELSNVLGIVKSCDRSVKYGINIYDVFHPQNIETEMK